MTMEESGMGRVPGQVVGQDGQVIAKGRQFAPERWSNALLHFLTDDSGWMPARQLTIGGLSLVHVRPTSSYKLFGTSSEPCPEEHCRRVVSSGTVDVNEALLALATSCEVQQVAVTLQMRMVLLLFRKRGMNRLFSATSSLPLL